MLDILTPIKMQRSKGAAHVAFGLNKGRPALRDLHQSGAAKVLFPRVSGGVPEVVFLNTSGGLTGGDSLEFSMEIGAESRISATTQTAERAYAASHGTAQINIKARVAAGARLDWMPQETILFQHSNLKRRCVIDLAPGASCLLAESLVLGRKAMGETLASATLHDHRMVRRAGKPVWVDSFWLNNSTLSDRSGALLGDCRALAVVCLVAQGAEDAVGALRLALGADAAISGWNGRCVVRLWAADGWPLRQSIGQVLRILTGRALPRVWQSGGIA